MNSPYEIRQLQVGDVATCRAMLDMFGIAFEDVPRYSHAQPDVTRVRKNRVDQRVADGQAQVEVRFEQETVWLNLQQMADVFGRDKSVISRHLKNMYAEGELSLAATVAKNATVQTEGRRKVQREIAYYKPRRHPLRGLPRQLQGDPSGGRCARHGHGHRARLAGRRSARKASTTPASATPSGAPPCCAAGAGSTASRWIEPGPPRRRPLKRSALQAKHPGHRHTRRPCPNTADRN